MRKAFILSILGLVLVVVLVWSANYLSTGTIIISTDKGSTITLQKTSQGSAYTKIGLGVLTATVHHGLYLATIKNGSKTSVQVISIENGHHTLRYNIKLRELETIEPVAYQNAKDITADNNQILFLDSSTAKLHRIDSQNKIYVLNSSQFLQSVKWVDPSFGVAQDTNGHLYTVVNGSINKLSLPFAYTSSAVNFDVSVDRQIYISNGSTVYRGSASGGFKEIYTATTSNPSIIAGAKAAAVIDSPKDIQNDVKPLLAIISTNDTIVKKGINVPRLVWSPSGKYLLDVAGASIYDLSLHKTATIPTNTYIGSASWTSDSELLYTSSDNELWSYRFPVQRAELSVVTTLHKSITGLAVNSDGSFAYVTTVNSSSNQSVGRVGLREQQVTPLLRRLEEVLPLTVSDGSISLINFGQPLTVLVESSPKTSLPPESYLQEARAALTSNGIDVTSVLFRLQQGG